MANVLKLRRRVLIDIYSLFLNYPPGIISMIAGTEPRKALRCVQRIATRIWEKAEPYNERAQKLDELREKLLKSFQGRDESIREVYVEKVALRPTDEGWKAEQEVLRDAAMLELVEAKEEALWKGGHFQALWAHQYDDGMEYDEVEFPKDLREMLGKCFDAYLADRCFVPEEEPTEEKAKKIKKPRFVIQRRSGPFGGTQEVPIVISSAAEAELEYALGDYEGETEEKDLAVRIEQLWNGDRKQMERRMKQLEEKYGPAGDAPPLV